jgi:predicted permease
MRAIDLPASLTTGWKMLRSPGELPAIVAALAVGVGLTTAAYALVHAVLFTPLPYERPNRLVQVWDTDTDVSQPDLRVIHERRFDVLASVPAPFQAVAGFAGGHMSLDRGPGAAPAPLAGAVVSDRLFEVLGVRAAAGRALQAGDARATDVPPIVISERLVRSGVIAGRIGDTLTLDGALYRLVGIMPAAFWFPDRQADYWTPMPKAPPSVVRAFPAVARLAEGVSIASAASQADARLSELSSASGRPPAAVASYASLLRAPVRSPLLVLQAASVLVLLLVCLDAGWLFSARARRLRPAFLTMRALGATRAHVLCAHGVSALCVAMAAAPAAVFIAWLLLRFGMTLESGVLSRLGEPSMTGHVLGAACLLTAFASAAAWLPGAYAVFRDRHALTGGTRAVTRRRLFDRSVMVAQVALVFAVGAEAVLVADVLRRVADANVGFLKTDFAVVSLQRRAGVVSEPGTELARYKALLSGLDRRGVRAALTNMFPLTGSDSTTTMGARPSRAVQREQIRQRMITPSYFAITGVAATVGRLIGPGDAGQFHAVVSERLVDSIGGRDRVLGRPIGFDGRWTVVGVAPVIRQMDFYEHARPEAYVLYDDVVVDSPARAASALAHGYLIAETARGARATEQMIRAAIAAEMPDVDVRSIASVPDLIAERLGVKRLVAAASVAFAGVAVLLAAVGVYGMVGYGLALRQREIGIRMALGATAGRIARESAHPIAIVFGAGVSIGWALFAAAKSAIESVILPPPGTGYPPLAGVAAAVTAVIVGMLIGACARPVAIAAKTDPAVALRVD